MTVGSEPTSTGSLLAWLGLSILGIVIGNVAAWAAAAVASLATCSTCTGTIDPAFWFTWLLTSVVVSVAAWKATRPRYTGWPRWFVGNGLRFLMAFAISWWAFDVVQALRSDEGSWIDLLLAPIGGLMFGGWIYGLGLLVYLLAMALLSRIWTDRRRRVTAILLAPLIGIAWIGFSVDWPLRLLLVTGPPLLYGIFFVDINVPHQTDEP